MSELRAEIGDEDLIAILGVYLGEAGRTLDALDAGAPPDGEERALHFLRSGALNLGLRGIARAADVADLPGIRAALAATRDRIAAAPG